MHVKRIARTFLDKTHLFRLALRCREHVWPFFGIPLAKIRYDRTLRRLRRQPGDKPFRVLFLVGEPAKWKCQTLFDTMRSDPLFEPIVCLTDWNNQSAGSMSDDDLDALHTRFESDLDRRGMTHLRAYNLHPRSGIDLETFAPDLVFYSEPWGPRWMQTPGPVSRFALTFFIPYFVPSHGDLQVEGHQTLHRFLFEYIALNDAWAELFRTSYRFHSHAPRFVGLGHPALDVYASCNPETSGDGYVVYAPHHSIPNPSHDYVYAFSTFEWSGRVILDYARKHPEIRWVFKPHPLLRTHLVKTGTMTESEVADYYRAWESLGEACYDANYRTFFLKARLLVTDSCSFLTEFGATGKPILHLHRNDNGVVYLPPSKTLFDTYYRADDAKELEVWLDRLLAKGEDPRRDERLAAVRAAGLSDTNASEAIVGHLQELLGR